MQVRVFTIPMDGDPDAIEELNAFLRGQKVLSVEKVPVVDHGRHYSRRRTFSAARPEYHFEP